MSAFIIMLYNSFVLRYVMNAIQTIGAFLATHKDAIMMVLLGDARARAEEVIVGVLIYKLTIGSNKRKHRDDDE